MQKKALRKNKVASHFERKEKATKMNKVTKRFNKKKEIVNANRNMSEVSFLDQRITKCN